MRSLFSSPLPLYPPWIFVFVAPSCMHITGLFARAKFDQRLCFSRTLLQTERRSRRDRAQRLYKFHSIPFCIISSLSLFFCPMQAPSLGSAISLFVIASNFVPRYPSRDSETNLNKPRNQYSNPASALFSRYTREGVLL